MKTKPITTAIILTLLALAAPAFAAVRLPEIFSDNMVLQQDKPLTTAKPH